MSATQLERGRIAPPRPHRRFAGAVLPAFLAVMIAAGIAATVTGSTSDDGAQNGGTTIDRPAHAPGANGELRPT